MYLDHDGGGVGVEELVVDLEQEFLVPCRVCIAVLIDPCQQFAFWVKPCDRVGVHDLGYWLEVLC